MITDYLLFTGHGDFQMIFMDKTESKHFHESVLWPDLNIIVQLRSFSLWNKYIQQDGVLISWRNMEHNVKKWRLYSLFLIRV